MNKEQLKELVKKYFSLTEMTETENTSEEKQNFDSATLVDGTKITNKKDSSFAVGDELYVTTEAGEEVLAPSGEHTTESGITVTVDGEGKITGIARPEGGDEGSLAEHEEEMSAESVEEKVEMAYDEEDVMAEHEEEEMEEHDIKEAIVEAIADRKAEERASDIDKRLKEIEELRVDAKRQRAEAELLQMHPDFEQLRQDDAFHNWAEEQPKWVQDALYENTEDAKSVARVIDLYKTDKGITTKTNRDTEKAAAASVKTKGSSIPDTDDTSKYVRESEVAAMSIKEYERRQEEILDAQRSGKFIYDISRK